MISEEMKIVIEQGKKFQARLLKWLNPATINVERWRQAEDLTSTIESMPDDAKCQKINANGLICELITTPHASKKHTIYYVHGGSYIAGSISRSRPSLGRWSKMLNVCVFSVEYRLAPEYPFPAGLYDCLRAYRWLITTGGIKSDNIIFFGSSAGGGLTLATLIKLRDAGDPMPIAVILQSPWLDLSLSGDSVKSKSKEDPILNEVLLKFAAKCYYGENEPKNPLISPLFSDLHDLPPLFIQAGTAEILLDDSVRLAEIAKKVGVDVELKIWEGMPHGFIGLNANIPEVQEGRTQIANFMKKYF